jgi:hypothetical protein
VFKKKRAAHRQTLREIESTKPQNEDEIEISLSKKEKKLEDLVFFPHLWWSHYFHFFFVFFGGASFAFCKNGAHFVKRKTTFFSNFFEALLLSLVWRPNSCVSIVALFEKNEKFY